mgnify:FL=1
MEGHKYKTSESIIGDLADIVSKNGVLLLNIGPKADGTIPEEERSLLLAIGDWLGRNGEAIYGTKPWTVYGEGPTRIVTGTFNDTKRSAFTGSDIRFTSRGDVLYAIVLGKPDGRRVSIRSLAGDNRLYPGEIGSVALLGSERELQWTRTPDALEIELPGGTESRFGPAFRITKRQP